MRAWNMQNSVPDRAPFIITYWLVSRGQTLVRTGALILASDNAPARRLARTRVWPRKTNMLYVTDLSGEKRKWAYTPQERK